jgi:hypothetical protein
MLIFGGLAIYFAAKGLRQRRELGRSIVAPIAIIVIGIMEVIGSIGIVALIVWAFVRASGRI